jgi:hypothetical protein
MNTAVTLEILGSIYCSEESFGTYSDEFAQFTDNKQKKLGLSLKKDYLTNTEETLLKRLHSCPTLSCTE